MKEGLDEQWNFGANGVHVKLPALSNSAYLSKGGLGVLDTNWATKNA